ncbi:MAG TPA: hypothetical protein VF473_00750, partial [Cyclobacteriaceae bacterium]
MKRKIQLTIAAACLIVATAASAQEVQPTNSAATSTVVKGTPYLDDSYVKGAIVFANNTRTVQLRYNAYKDLMEFQADGQARVLDPSTTIKKVNFGETTFVVEKYVNDKGINKYGYFTLLDTGKVSLFSKKSVKFTPGLKGRALDGGDQPAEYRRNPDEFYFKIDGGEMTEVNNIKTMIAAFPDKQDELLAFAKKEK